MKNVIDYSDMIELLYKSSNIPSKNRANYWMGVMYENGFCSSKFTGKWCVFKDAKDVDDCWFKITQLCEIGKIVCAKVSTNLARENSGKDKHVICVYTKDYRDKDDLENIRTMLRDIGITEDLGYKRDEDTRNNVYGEDEWYYRSV